MKIKIKILLLICLCLIPLFSLISCSREIIDRFYLRDMEQVKPTIEVTEVGSYVKYKLIDDKENEEVYLVFNHSEYKAKDSQTSNDYYIVSRYEYLSPLDLHVGDKIVLSYTSLSSSSNEKKNSITCSKLYLYE